MSKREKRDHPRTEFLKRVTCEIGTPVLSAEAVDVETLNISSGGACIMTERTLEPGRVVMLRCPHSDTDMPIPRLAKVRWVASTLGRFKMGLKFYK
jgi:hypothetical protein